MADNINNHFCEKREKCHACASGSFRIIYQNKYNEPPIKDYLASFYSEANVEFEYLEEAIFILCECDVCEMIFQRDIPNETLMKRLYEHWIDPEKTFELHEKRDNLAYYSCYAQEIMQVVSYFRKEPSYLKFLDFGMGWGKWALMAKAFGCDSYGTELSAKRIEYAESNGIKVISWDEIIENRFDFINTEQVFEHIPEPLLTLRYLKEALKPQGLIKISVPTANDIKRRLRIMDWKSPKGTRNSLNPVAPLEHINCYSRKSLIKMANEAGMIEDFIPVKLQYRYTTYFGGGMKINVKNLLRPLYRNILKRKNNILFRKV